MYAYLEQFSIIKSYLSYRLQWLFRDGAKSCRKETVSTEIARCQRPHSRKPCSASHRLKHRGRVCNLHRMRNGSFGQDKVSLCLRLRSVADKVICSRACMFSCRNLSDSHRRSCASHRAGNTATFELAAFMMKRGHFPPDQEFPSPKL